MALPETAQQVADQVDPTTAYFFQQGLLGVIIVVLLGVIARLWTLLGKKDEKIETLQNSRLEDTKQALGSVAAAVKTVEATISALQTLGRK